MQYHLSEDKDGKQTLICDECNEFYLLEEPKISFHSKDCKYNPYVIRREENIEKWGSWTKNVQNKFKPLSQEEIIEELRKNMLPCAVLACNIEGDFNLGNIIRTANAYNLNCVYYFGKRKFNRKSCMGTYKYIDVKPLINFNDIELLKEKYHFVGLENNINKKTYDIDDYKFKNNTLLVVGEENSGIPNNIIDLCDDLIEIKLAEFGSVRSLNLGSAAAIAINKLCFQIRTKY